VYLEGEEHAERAVLLDPVTHGAPDWLKRWLVKHRADEARHAEMLKARITQLTGEPALAEGRMDPVSRWKMRRLEGIARRAAPKFDHGLLVPLVAIAWRMERMGVRVFARHVEVLRGKESKTLPMLERILRDEKKHVAACEWALARLVSSHEWNDLQRLVLQIDRVERAFGVLGAVILFGMGVVLWLGSSTSRSPTLAAT
jgi:bacterioferritin (cytochrome b1)